MRMSLPSVCFGLTARVLQQRGQSAAFCWLWFFRGKGRSSCWLLRSIRAGAQGFARRGITGSCQCCSSYRQQHRDRYHNSCEVNHRCRYLFCCRSRACDWLGSAGRSHISLFDRSCSASFDRHFTRMAFGNASPPGHGLCNVLHCDHPDQVCERPLALTSKLR